MIFFLSGNVGRQTSSNGLGSNERSHWGTSGSGELPPVVEGQWETEQVHRKFILLKTLWKASLISSYIISDSPSVIFSVLPRHPAPLQPWPPRPPLRFALLDSDPTMEIVHPWAPHSEETSPFGTPHPTATFIPAWNGHSYDASASNRYSCTSCSLRHSRKCYLCQPASKGNIWYLTYLRLAEQ
jgi:hypothetical protein